MKKSDIAPAHDAHVETYLRRTKNVERLRRARHAKAAAQGREVRAWLRRGHADLPYHMKPGAREQRNAYKRAKRAERGAKARKLHDAHVKRWQQWSMRKVREPKHDAHVVLFRSDDARYMRWRTANDPAFRINQRLRIQIRKALKGEKRGRTWESIVGYTLAELMAHFMRMLPRDVTLRAALERGWHIDHIVPKSSFDLANPAELRAAWALPNLRLIPAEENWRKGARMERLL